MKEEFKTNMFHARIIHFLISTYPEAAISIYEIAKNYKHGNADRYSKAMEDLVKSNYVIDQDGFSLNPNIPQLKPLINIKDQNVREAIKNNAKKFEKFFFNKDNWDSIVEIGKTMNN